jgi:polyisoprenoid-binding protein YceI
MAATRTVGGVALPAVATWVIDPTDSHIEFSVRHMVVGKTRGRFAGFTGIIVVAEEPASSSVHVGLEGMVTKDPWGDARVAFSGETEINREQFGLTWNVALDTGGVLVGKTVKIDFEIEAVKHD